MHLDQIWTHGQASAPADYVCGDNVKVTTHYELQCGCSLEDNIITGQSNPERAAD